MNGFEALELMRNGKKVVSKESGRIYFLNEGKIYIERKTLDHFKCCFDFNGEYELYEEIYTGLEAIELMKEGHLVMDEKGTVTKIEQNKVKWYSSYEKTWQLETSFNFTYEYKIYDTSNGML